MIGGNGILKKEELQKIAELRKIGIGYRSIASAMGLSRDAVRYQAKIMGLDGYGDDVKQKPIEETNENMFCKNCGVAINIERKTGRRKTYCSSICKKKWEYDHPLLYEYVCYYCGDHFRSRSSDASFCSHKCYVRNRFYRKEDLKEIMGYLQINLLVPNAPGWIKDLIKGNFEQEYRENNIRRNVSPG